MVVLRTGAESFRFRGVCGWQIANLRYGRLPVCVTSKGGLMVGVDGPRLVIRWESGGDPPHSKRFATYVNARQSRSAWSACALAPLSHGLVKAAEHWRRIQKDPVWGLVELVPPDH